MNAWVPISPAIGGTVNEMKLFATGSSEGIPGVSSNTVRGEQRSYESNAWLMPDAATYGDDVLVSTADRNYTASDLDAFFTGTLTCVVRRHKIGTDSDSKLTLTTTSAPPSP